MQQDYTLEHKRKKYKIKEERANFFFLDDGSMIYPYEKFNSYWDALIDSIVNCGEDIDDMISLVFKEKYDHPIVKEKLLKEIEKRNPEKITKERIITFFNNLQSFKKIDDIPEIPITDNNIYNNVIVPNLIRCGAIPKDKLIIGETYLGSCRNSSEATWDGTQFNYKRYKFGTWFDDEINHFQDDDGYDVFIPIAKIE